MAPESIEKSMCLTEDRFSRMGLPVGEMLARGLHDGMGLEVSKAGLTRRMSVAGNDRLLLYELADNREDI